MRQHLRGHHPAHAGGLVEWPAPQQSVEEARREHVACAGGVDQIGDRFGGHHSRLGTAQRHRTLGSAGQCRRAHLRADRLDRFRVA